MLSTQTCQVLFAFFSTLIVATLGSVNVTIAPATSQASNVNATQAANGSVAASISMSPSVSQSALVRANASSVSVSPSATATPALSATSHASAASSNGGAVSASTSGTVVNSVSKNSISPTASSSSPMASSSAGPVPVNHHCHVEMPTKEECKLGCCTDGLTAVANRNITLDCTLKNMTKIPVKAGCYVCSSQCSGNSAVSLQLGVLAAFASILLHSVLCL